MSRQHQQLLRLAMPLLRMAQRKLGVAGIVVLGVLGLLYVAVVQPMVAERFGMNLPTITDVADAPSETAPAGRPDRAEPAPKIDTGQLSDVLTETGRDTYRSKAGLRYTRGSKHGTRLAHVMSHARDEPNRVGQHGVFVDDDPAAVVRLVDEAYTQALSGRNTRTQREGERTVYNVDLGRRVGYIGGQSGNRRGKPPAEHVRLVVEGDRLITAFPVRP